MNTINLSNLAELNPALSYNQLQPMNLKQYDYDELNNDTPAFSKYQDNILNDNFTSDSKTDNYCGGNSGMSSKVLNIEQSDLSQTYFSDENIKRINKKLRREIYRKTNSKFDVFKDSDDLDILTNMNIVFDEHARHLPNQIIRQVKILNNITVDYILSNAITVIDQHSKYLKQLDQPIIPMDRPLNVNNGGRKTLPSLTSRLGF